MPRWNSSSVSSRVFAAVAHALGQVRRVVEHQPDEATVTISGGTPLLCPFHMKDASHGSDQGS